MRCLAGALLKYQNFSASGEIKAVGVGPERKKRGVASGEWRERDHSKKMNEFRPPFFCLVLNKPGAFCCKQDATDPAARLLCSVAAVGSISSTCSDDR